MQNTTTLVEGLNELDSSLEVCCEDLVNCRECNKRANKSHTVDLMHVECVVDHARPSRRSKNIQ